MNLPLWKAFLLVEACGLSSASALGPSEFQSGAVTGTVIDANTREAVSDVVVVVVWTLYKPVEGADKKRFFQLEGKTDATGRFRFEAWGPKAVEPSWGLARSSPCAYILRTGYRFKILCNYVRAFGGTVAPGAVIPDQDGDQRLQPESLVVVSWNGIEVQLSDAPTDQKSYASSLYSIRADVCGRRPEVACGPIVMEFFDAESKRLRALGVHPYF